MIALAVFGVAQFQRSSEEALTASIGVATYPLQALDGETLLRGADRALYAAKAAGRNRVRVAEVDGDRDAPDPFPSPQPAT